MASVAERPKAKSLAPLRALVPFLAPHWRLLAIAMAALLVAAAAQLALPIALRNLIDEGLAVRDAATINRYFVLFLGAGAVFGAFAALRFFFIMWLGERVVADIRSAVYAKVIRMDPTFFEVTRTGEVLSRLTADTTLIQAVAGFGISLTLRSALTLLGSLVLLVLTSPMLTLLIVVLIPLVVGPLLLLGRRVRRLSRDSQDRTPMQARWPEDDAQCTMMIQSQRCKQAAEAVDIFCRGSAAHSRSWRADALACSCSAASRSCCGSAPSSARRLGG
jgi:ATP-binding cassette subfamily B protein